jgi:hypothetical protein
MTPREGVLVVDLSRRGDPVHDRHSEVHQDDVWAQLGGQPYGGGPVSGLAHHIDVRFAGQDEPEAGAHQVLIIRHHDSDHDD